MLKLCIPLPFCFNISLISGPQEGLVGRGQVVPEWSLDVFGPLPNVNRSSLLSLPYIMTCLCNWPIENGSPNLAC